jgi:hypothetical protein
MEHPRGLDLTGMGVAGGFDDRLPFPGRQHVLGQHGDFDVGKASEQLFSGIDQGRGMGAAGMTGQKNEIAQTLRMKSRDDVDSQKPQRRRGDGEGPRMPGGGTADPVGNGRGDENGTPFRQAASDFGGVQGVGGQGEMRPMLFRRPEGDKNCSGPDKPGFELGHGHFFDDHGSTSSALAITRYTSTKTKRTCDRRKSFF